ncbi:hypothetical protein IJ135_00395 [Candidatus Saccharibacteria bacterium]|nr:hypothetical protein [Candidatus Saccharibacteria bacterium]
MKKTYFSVLVAAIGGFLIAYFVTNLMYPALDSFSFKNLDETSSNFSSIVMPSEEIFNYRAINPTVEVYVGECDSYDANGKCLTNSTLRESNNTEENDATSDAENENGDEGSDVDDNTAEDESGANTNGTTNGASNVNGGASSGSVNSGASNATSGGASSASSSSASSGGSNG